MLKKTGIPFIAEEKPTKSIKTLASNERLRKKYLNVLIAVQFVLSVAVNHINKLKKKGNKVINNK